MALITTKLLVRDEADPEVWMEVEIQTDGRVCVETEFGNEMGGVLMLQPAEARALAEFITERLGKS